MQNQTANIEDYSSFGLFLLVIGIILSIFAVFNFISIVFHYYLLKHEVEEVKDDDLKVDLLQSLNSISNVFFRKVLYHDASDFFNDRKVYNKFTRYRIGVRPTIMNTKKEKIGYAKEVEPIDK